ncbi:hypothetical protein ACFL2D_00450 [Patescibacteria group bacterium]
MLPIGEPNHDGARSKSSDTLCFDLLLILSQQWSHSPETTLGLLVDKVFSRSEMMCTDHGITILETLYTIEPSIMLTAVKAQLAGKGTLSHAFAGAISSFLFQKQADDVAQHDFEKDPLAKLFHDCLILLLVSDRVKRDDLFEWGFAELWKGIKAFMTKNRGNRKMLSDILSIEKKKLNPLGIHVQGEIYRDYYGHLSEEERLAHALLWLNNST